MKLIKNRCLLLKIDFFSRKLLILTQIDFVKNNDTRSSIEKLKNALDHAHRGKYFLRYSACVVLLFSQQHELTMLGVNMLNKMKTRGFFGNGLDICRTNMKREFMEYECLLNQHPLRINRPAVICRNRVEHRCQRTVDRWREEQSDDCNACDADREIEFIMGD